MSRRRPRSIRLADQDAIVLDTMRGCGFVGAWDLWPMLPDATLTGIGRILGRLYSRGLLEARVARPRIDDPEPPPSGRIFVFRVRRGA